MITLTAQTRIVAIDLETTGLSFSRDRVVEVAAVCWHNGRETGVFHSLVNPERWIPASVIRIHGITDEMVKDQPAMADILPPLLECCDADLLVAHNASFDVQFLQGECQRAGVALRHGMVVDTRDLAKIYLPECPNYRLETIKTVLGFGDQQAHRALADARDCLEIFLKFHARHCRSALCADYRACARQQDK